MNSYPFNSDSKYVSMLYDALKCFFNCLGRLIFKSPMGMAAKTKMLKKNGLADNLKKCGNFPPHFFDYLTKNFPLIIKFNVPNNFPTVGICFNLNSTFLAVSSSIDTFVGFLLSVFLNQEFFEDTESDGWFCCCT